MKLPEEVAAKYAMEGNHAPGEYHWRGQVVKLQHISLEHADRLFDAGFPYLVLKPKAESAKPKGKTAALGLPEQE